MKNTYEFWVNPDIDLTKIKDSMQLDSNQVVATLKYGDYTVSYEVQGEVRVRFDGDLYTRPSEFPQELKDMIAQGGFWELTNSDRVDVGNNNWFEVFCREPEGLTSCNVVDIEGFTVTQLVEEAYRCLEELRSYDKTTEADLPVEWERGR